jgi:hypothetical protein
MTRFIRLAIIPCLLLCSPTFAEDLYLLTIGSYESLEIVKSTVNHAHGTIDGKFIISIDSEQSEHLAAAGLTLELIARDWNDQKFHVVRKTHRRIPDTPLSLKAQYSTKNMYLAEVERAEIDILRRDGYSVRKISERRTPFFYHPPTEPGLMPGSFPSDTIADLVSQDSLYSYDTRLEDFQTRHIISDSIDMARTWLVQKFFEFGYTDVVTQYFEVTDEYWGVYDEPCYNVICRKPGTQNPDKLIIIGAHYDSYNHDSDYTVFAPGADDDASGTAGVLELARILKDYETRNTILFTPFSAEEYGLYGSEYMASEFYEDSADIEFVLNFDMIGFTEDTYPDVEIAGYQYTSHRNVVADAATRVTYLVPVIYSYGVSDDLSFYDYGYISTGIIEADFNYAGWHTNIDISSRMDFFYLKEIVRAAAAGIVLIDQAPEPISFDVYDVGDGQALRLIWEDCHENYNYIIPYGTHPAILSDTAHVPPLSCSYDLTGLTEGTMHYMRLVGIPDEGVGPLSVITKSAVPLSVPRHPDAFSAEPDSGAIILKWQPNIELDLDHYKILRKQNEEPWSVLENDYTDTIYFDYNVVSLTQYFYCVLAVDSDGYESDSAMAPAVVPANLDGGPMIVDETHDLGDNPSETQQLQFYTNAFDTVGFYLTRFIDSNNIPSRSKLGPYNPLFYVDDDDSLHLLELTFDTLQWYFNYHTDFFLAGWRSIYSFTGHRHFHPGDFIHDNFGISYIAENYLADFMGATGLNGWPDLETKPDAPYNGRVEDISIFTGIPGTEVIYTFNSFYSHPTYGDKPVGIALDTYHGKRVILSFPLYCLTEESARALIAKAFEYFAEESILYGDCNGDWSVNMLDILYLIAYLYKGAPPPIDINNGDVNSTCTIDMLDIIYLIGYLYKAGPEPMGGCVE